MTDTEWPKTWNDIRGVDPFRQHREKASFPDDQWMQIGDGLRSYEGTLYVNERYGSEAENGNLWSPFDVYVQRVVTNTIEQREGAHDD